VILGSIDSASNHLAACHVLACVGMAVEAGRNAQFEKITELKQAYLAAGNPVISIDTKKKEMLGNFHRDGVTDAVEPTITISPAVATANSFLMAFTTFTRTKRHCI
jgi:hypothetical protein